MHHLVTTAGFEPATLSLEGSCSIQLSYVAKVERSKGIEPSALAWKARVLPLYELRIKLVRVVGLEPTILSAAKIWCPWWDSNPHFSDFKSLTSASWVTRAIFF